MNNGAIPQSVRGEERARSIKAVLWVVLLLNWSVAAMKIVLGLWTSCTVIVADGIHSLSDGASNIIGLVGISIASHPADRGHPYGHRKFETLASLVISFALFFAAASILKECVNQFFRPVQAEVSAYSFGVMGITLVVNAFTAMYERRRGKQLKSDLLTADAWHTFSDVFVTLSVFAALIGIWLGWRRLDTFISVGIAFFIGSIALRILMRSMDVLADRAVIEEDAIRRIVMGIAGVEDCHEIRSRGREDDMRIDLHILVAPQMSVEKSHGVSNVIEKELRARFDVLVHIEPLHHDHTELEGA